MNMLCFLFISLCYLSIFIIVSSDIFEILSNKYCWDDVFETIEDKFKLTPRMCLKSRINYSNNYKILQIIQKLKNGLCLRVAIFGGSISIGSNIF